MALDAPQTETDLALACPTEETRLQRRREGRLVEDLVADVDQERLCLAAPAYPDGPGRARPARRERP